jgi:alkaline phosphatase
MKLNRFKIASLVFISIFISLVGCNSVNKNNSNQAKYVFYFIGDGMSYQQIAATQAYLGVLNDTIENVELSFTNFPVTGVSTTNSFNRYVTCSAAAGTALATGSKTSVGTIGLNHDHSDSLFSIAHVAHNQGYKVGIVTSVSIDHATPAAFYAHQTSRELYHEIAHDLIESRFRFYGSGGLRDPEGKKSEAPRGNVYEKGRQNGFFFSNSLSIPDSVLNSNKSIFYSSPNPALSSTLKYQIDNTADDVTLAQITSKAIDVLKSSEGFFLMVEGGKIDWSCHDNDAATTIHEIIAFSDAIAIAYEFYTRYPNQTLIIVTSDHETGGMSVGNKLHGYDTYINLLANQKYSLDRFKAIVDNFINGQKNKPNFNQVLDFLSLEMGIGSKDLPLSSKQIIMLQEAYKANIASQTPDQKRKNKEVYGSNDPVAITAMGILNQMAGIGWTSGKHTGSHVPIYAIGNGQQLFMGQIENIQIPIRIAQAMGLKFK